MRELVWVVCDCSGREEEHQHGERLCDECGAHIDWTDAVDADDAIVCQECVLTGPETDPL